MVSAGDVSTEVILTVGFFGGFLKRPPTSYDFWHFWEQLLLLRWNLATGSCADPTCDHAALDIFIFIYFTYFQDMFICIYSIQCPELLQKPSRSLGVVGLHQDRGDG